MDEATKQAALTALRTILIAIGGWMTAKGWIDDATVQMVVAAVITLATVAWSIYASRKKEIKAEHREVEAFNIGAVNASTALPPEEAKAVIAEAKGESK